MCEFFTIFTIATALSMDTFSLSLGIGTYNLKKKQMVLFSAIVGLMHFLMPILGNLIGSSIVNLFAINSNFLLGMILMYLSISMFIDCLKTEHQHLVLNLSTMILLGFSVSIDSFTVGLGINAITNNIFLSVLTFSLCSFSFTYLGLLIGKYAKKILGTYATLLGAILLFIISLFNLCK
jgi:putative Mn2+ efflux pump MntP